MDLQRCRLVLALLLQLGMGAVPLRSLASIQPARLVLGSGLPLESSLGALALV